MGDLMVWLVLGSFLVLLFCIYSLSSQLERCVRLAVEIITGNQRKIIEQLEALAQAQSPPQSLNVVPFERRMRQRRRSDLDLAIAHDRRLSPGRRREDRQGFAHRA